MKVPVVLKNILASPKFSSKYKSSWFDEAIGATLGKNSLGNQSMAAVEAKHCRMMRRIKQDDTTNFFIVARFSPFSVPQTLKCN